MGNTIIRPKEREEWLEIRKSGIGSSEVATIVGLNPWETPYQLWRRKKGLDEPKQENFAMKAGHYLEDAVSRFWADETGREVIKRSAGDWIIRDNERSYLQVSPDRTYWTGDVHNDNNKGILECKTTQMDISADELPKHWFCQVQYQLGVAGYEHGSLAWLTRGREFGYKDIDFVPDFYAWLVDEVDKFWNENIIGGKEPSSISVKDVLIKFDKVTDGKSIETNPEIYDAWTELKNVKAEMKVLADKQAELEDRIKIAFGDAESMTYNGQTLATWKAGKPSKRFDANALKAEDPTTYAKYMREQQGVRRFLVK
jgi:putative phage-type endonuclease